MSGDLTSPAAGLATRLVTAPDGFLLPAGTYWCNVVAYYDGSGMLGAYGPYASEAAAASAGISLRAAGVYVDERWELKPLRLIDPGAEPGSAKGDGES